MLFKRFFNKKDAITKESTSCPEHKEKTIDDYIRESANQYAESGVYITDGVPDGAMRVGTAFSCSDLISSKVACIPMRLEHFDGKRWQPSSDDIFRLNRALTIQPSSDHTYYSFWKTVVWLMLNRGNAYVYPKKIGRDITFILLDNSAVVYDRYSRTFNVNDLHNGVSGTFPQEKILHFKINSFDGGEGRSVIHFATTVLNLSANSDIKVVRDLRKDNKMSGIISGGDMTTPFGNYTDKQRDEIGDKVRAQIGNGNSIIVLPKGANFNPLSITSRDAELLETRKYSPIDICRFYRTPPHKVYVMSSNYKAQEGADDEFYEDTIRPYVENIQSELTAKLIGYNFQGKYRIAFDTSGLIKMSSAKKAEYYDKMISTGVMTINEIRIKEGLDPLEGGDQLMISRNLAPITSNYIQGEEKLNDNGR